MPTIYFARLPETPFETPKQHQNKQTKTKKKNNNLHFTLGFLGLTVRFYQVKDMDKMGVGKIGTGKNGTGKNGTGKNGTRKKRHPEEMALCKFGKNGTSRKNVSLFS